MIKEAKNIIIIDMIASTISRNFQHPATDTKILQWKQLLITMHLAISAKTDDTSQLHSMNYSSAKDISKV